MHLGPAKAVLARGGKQQNYVTPAATPNNWMVAYSACHGGREPPVFKGHVMSLLRQTVHLVTLICIGKAKQQQVPIVAAITWPHPKWAKVENEPHNWAQGVAIMGYTYENKPKCPHNLLQ
jgi:hypothetical protein